jgi:hypothetical protein
MNPRFVDYLYIAATIGFTVYGQLILKWRIRDFGALPAEPLDKLKFLVYLLFDPAIFLDSLLHSRFLSLDGGDDEVRSELRIPVHEPDLRARAPLSGWLLSGRLVQRRRRGPDCDWHGRGWPWLMLGIRCFSVTSAEV